MSDFDHWALAWILFNREAQIPQFLHHEVVLVHVDLPQPLLSGDHVSAGASILRWEVGRVYVLVEGGHVITVEVHPVPGGPRNELLEHVEEGVQKPVVVDYMKAVHQQGEGDLDIYLFAITQV